jgi:hypothetical protein
MKSKPVIPQARFLRAAIAKARDKSKQRCSDKVRLEHGRAVTFLETLLDRVERAAKRRR